MGTQRSSAVSPRLRRIAELARRMPDTAFTTLAHHIDEEFLEEAYQRTRKDGAAGIDGQTADEYGANLRENLESLLGRFKAGTYRAPPVKRVHIPKGGGKTRPIGIPTFEDKVLQRAVAMVLEAIYEQEFLNCSYGFRPGRSAHQALEAIWEILTRMGGGWVLDVDISSFFDTLSHEHLRRFVAKRVRDGVISRITGKWLNAGVMESGALSYPRKGTPQGGVISPLLANIYLHEVLDKWFEQEVRPRLQGQAHLIRFADDFVIICEYRADAERVLAVLPKRLARYSLTMHPEKTKLVDFRRPPSNSGQRPKSGTFDLLGFTHFWGKSRKGKPTVKRKTSKKRLNRFIRTMGEWCRTNRHLPVKAQHRRLSLALRGHDAYYGVTGNFQALNNLRYALRRIWRKWLDRRSHKAHMTWARFNLLLERYPLPAPRIVHSVYGRQIELSSV